eukprot:m.983098 g.983098  ORF g.983098 m.983098 type:complete len:321 (-) comp23973_c0_seq41:4018-4980(-)
MASSKCERIVRASILLYGCMFAGCADTSKESNQLPMGHLKPFGTGRKPSWEIAEIDAKDLSAKTFLEQYVNKRTPLVIRNETNSWPAFSLWGNDTYLSTAYGQLHVTIEHKLEAVPMDKAKVTLEDFLHTPYQSDRYVISELPQPMYKDVRVPPYLRCGPLSDRLAEMDLWVSNGGTSSVMHRDPFNQLNCVVSDSKRWTLIDAMLVSSVPFVWEDDVDPVLNTGGTVEFDWEAVDLLKYPVLSRIPFAVTDVHAGDCMPHTHTHTLHVCGLCVCVHVSMWVGVCCRIFVWAHAPSHRSVDTLRIICMMHTSDRFCVIEC